MAISKNKVRYAESRSRTYIVSELKQLGWDPRHPSRGGNVPEEQEAKHFDPRFDELLGADRSLQPQIEYKRVVGDNYESRLVLSCGNTFTNILSAFSFESMS